VVAEIQTAVRTREWKYIQTGDAGEELYHLASDPGENRNLRDERPDMASKLSGRLRQWMNEYPIHIDDPGPLNPELIENLRALGYME
jgi:arylsulfatase A-like enzyme